MVYGVNRDVDYPIETRELTYTQAIREALFQVMQYDKMACIVGQGINDQEGIWGITADLYKEFGEKRVLETPLSECGMMGMVCGMALNGFHPIYFHIRVDFLMLGMDQIVNHITKYSYMSGGQSAVPLVIWAASGQGWGSGAQHSQALQGLFMHLPGLKIIMPSTPYDAKGLLISAVEDRNPVLILEHRNNFDQSMEVPKGMYRIPLGQGVVRREGIDITIIAFSEMVEKAQKAAAILKNENISVEVIDLRTLNPLDKDIMLTSVAKTRRVIVTDTGYYTAGTSAELSSIIYENLFNRLLCPIERLTLPDIPTPASYSLEEIYYRTEEDICERARKMMKFNECN